jgi:hypothetical protein
MVSMEDLKAYASHALEAPAGEAVRRVLAVLEDVCQEPVQFAYARNLFVDASALEVVLMTARGHLLVAAVQAGRVRVRRLPAREIVETVYEAAPAEKDLARLRVGFRDGQALVLDSATDCNEHWRFKYANSIRALARMLAAATGG